MRAVDYDRVSTDEQAKTGYSIDSQKENNFKFIQSQGWEPVGSYVDDGYSAKNLNRPAMQRLIADAKAQKFDVVVFYRLDRLVRSVGDLDYLLKTFEEYNVKIRSVTEVYDTTSAMGRFFIFLVASMAQWERETISERVVVNMAKKATLGERNGGRAPYGYDLKDGQLVINEAEARFVREMFRLYNSGKGIRSIVLYLQQFNVNKDIRTIGRMIENPVYCGKIRWGKNSKMDEIISDSIQHPAIISEEVFERAQAIRSNNSKEGKKATSPYHFSGVLRCARCGSALSGYFKKARGSKHYICINKKNKGTCDLPMFTETALTDTFFQEVSSEDPDRFFQLAKNFNLDIEDNVAETELIKDLERELAAIKLRKKNWMLSLGNGVISQEDYIEMTQEDAKREALIKEQLGQLSVEKTAYDRDSIIDLLNSLPGLWSTANDFEKKSFINELFDTIVVDIPSDYSRGSRQSAAVKIREFSLK
ncbi:hypothetical protein DRW41_17150 [Neobacillus piezotolerans]|uniref:Recombinase family protein n=1 Tax=Neobacillus piezotolerans TaxID=2259171 RepID=A0A3D8GME8_9BACI|nr:recombinase family protein [Neobacillus piezotolerans]RDU35467.1 hypothetical protein DRW41_17150 [Neobacillus piezotolerans]